MTRMWEDNLVQECWCEKWKMLFKKALLRLLGFIAFAFVVPWLFVLVEQSEDDTIETKYQLLLSLHDSMASKYNMTVEEFKNFSLAAYEALSIPRQQWTYFAALDFLFQAITTIGKVPTKITVVFLRLETSSKFCKP